MTDYPDLIAKRAMLAPDLPAFEDVATGRQVSYREFDAAGRACAAVLHHAGVEPGDRVGVLCRNRIEFFEVLIACARIGALMVPLNWRMPAAELQAILADCQPKVVFVGAEDHETVAHAQFDGLIIDFDHDGVGGYQAFCEGVDPAPLRAFWPAEEPWYLLYTSGTTGKPKAVIQTPKMAVSNYVNVRQATNFCEGHATLNFLPLFHTAGINLHTLPFLFGGGCVRILPGFDVEKTMALLEDGAIDAFFGVPAVYQEISLHPNFSSVDLSRVSHWGCGGAPLPDVLVERFANRGALVCNGYGMTETGPTVFLVRQTDVRDHIGSVGHAQILAEARIVDETGAPAPVEVTGELQIKGPGVTPGYWRAPEQTEETFTDDGWLKTGDLARIDARGFAYIVGRSKEMYISGGENVYPAEVENVLARHPAIIETAIVAIADEKWGEVGCAFVLLKDGESLAPEALIAYARDNLAAYKAPKRVVFVDAFPRTAAGKIQKHLLEAH